MFLLPGSASVLGSLHRSLNWSKRRPWRASVGRYFDLFAARRISLFRRARVPQLALLSDQDRSGIGPACGALQWRPGHEAAQGAAAIVLRDAG